MFLFDILIELDLIGCNVIVRSDLSEIRFNYGSTCRVCLHLLVWKICMWDGVSISLEENRRNSDHSFRIERLRF